MRVALFFCLPAPPPLDKEGSPGLPLLLCPAAQSEGDSLAKGDPLAPGPSPLNSPLKKSPLTPMVYRRCSTSAERYDLAQGKRRDEQQAECLGWPHLVFWYRFAPLGVNAHRANPSTATARPRSSLCACQTGSSGWGRRRRIRRGEVVGFGGLGIISAWCSTGYPPTGNRGAERSRDEWEDGEFAADPIGHGHGSIRSCRFVRGRGRIGASFR